MGAEGFSLPILLCLFHVYSIEYPIACCIPMLPPLSLIHFINEEIILVDDLFIFIISISLVDGIMCLMLCS